MASKKDKHLESAQRFLLKGQLDKAIKDYQQVVALEPKEIRYRQKLAELLVRDSRKDEAIAQYEGIAKDYAENSHFLKAIAVYKQIQRLVPGNANITLQLAALNHKQGLIGNALAEYGQVVAQYEKEGAPKDALKVLEQMLVIDGEHAATRLKYAELLFSTGSKEASYEALSALHASLKRKGDAAVQQVAQRMRQLFPDRQPDEIEALSQRVSAGQHDAALENLREKVKRDPMNLQVWQLLCQAERAAGNSAALKIALGQMMNLFPDELGVLESGIRFHLDSGDFRGALALLELHLPRFLDAQAAATAEALFRAIPGDGALEPRVSDGLRRIYQATGDAGKLANLQQGGHSAPPQAPVAYGELPSAFGEAPAEAPSAFGEAPAEAPSAFAAEPAVISSAAPVAPAVNGAAWEEEIELDLDDDTTATAPAASEVELPLDFSNSLELEELTPEAELSFAGAGGAADAVAGDQASPFGEEASPFGEEASPFGELPSPFGDLPATFVEEEPPAVEAAPSSPFASSPFDDAPSAFGEEAPAAFGAPGSAFGAETSAEAVASSPDQEASPFADASLHPEEASGQAAVAGEIASGHFAADEEVFDGGQLDLTLPDDGEFPDIEWAEDLDVPAEPQQPVAEALEPVRGIDHDHELPPLQELEELEDLEESSHEMEGPHAVHEPVEAAFAHEAGPRRDWREIFPESAAGEPADPEELESHYDLGVGYKEMGMYGQAIKEFSMAAGNPKRRLDCLTLQAACYREKGEPEKAQDLLERGRELEVLSDGERAAIAYELAYLLEGTGAVDQAVELYREVLRHDRSFHDVAQRLSALTGEEPLDVIDLDLEEG